MERQKTIPVRSVQKALQILDMLVFEDPASGGTSLSEIARRMAMRPNSAHNLLKSMMACNYVRQNEQGHYIAGAAVEQIGKLNRLRSPGVTQVVVSCCRAASERLGESVVFVTLAGGRRIRIAAFDASNAIRVDHAAFEAQNIYRTPTGRVLVAMANEEQLDTVLARYGWPGENWDGISSRSELDPACEEIRRRGYETVDDRQSEITAMACPVVDANASLIGAIGCFAPSYRCGNEQQKIIVEELKAAAREISEQLQPA